MRAPRQGGGWTQAHWTVPVTEGLHPQMSVIIGGTKLQCLIDTGADRTVLRKEEVPTDWPLTPGPIVLGVGGNSWTEETSVLMKWISPDGDQGKVRPLRARGRTSNLLGQDLLG